MFDILCLPLGRCSVHIPKWRDQPWEKMEVPIFFAPNPAPTQSPEPSFLGNDLHGRCTYLLRGDGKCPTTDRTDQWRRIIPDSDINLHLHSLHQQNRGTDPKRKNFPDDTTTNSRTNFSSHIEGKPWAIWQISFCADGSFSIFFNPSHSPMLLKLVREGQLNEFLSFCVCFLFLAFRNPWHGSHPPEETRKRNDGNESNVPFQVTAGMPDMKNGRKSELK